MAIIRIYIQIRNYIQRYNNCLLRPLQQGFFTFYCDTRNIFRAAGHSSYIIEHWIVRARRHYSDYFQTITVKPYAVACFYIRIPYIRRYRGDPFPQMRLGYVFSACIERVIFIPDCGDHVVILFLVGDKACVLYFRQAAIQDHFRKDSRCRLVKYSDEFHDLMAVKSNLPQAYFFGTRNTIYNLRETTYDQPQDKDTKY